MDEQIDDGPWCTLITVTHNSGRALEDYWSGNTPDTGIEWIVVDNASTDDTLRIAKRLGARVIRNDVNRGFSYANNLGLRAANGSFIGFVNPDLRVDFEKLPALRAVALAENAVVAPQLEYPDGALQANGRGYPFLSSKVRNRLRGGDPRYLLVAQDDEPRPVCWVMGAAVFAMRETLDLFGAWDAHFFLYYEDKDICLRAWNARVPVLLVPGARFVHGWARETTGFRLAPWRRELASMAKFYRRYPEFLLGRWAARRKHPEIHARVFGSEQ
ncbi:glycosyltransferase [Microbacterium sp. CJ77]|uniref:glycosyltransferase n=1 Tax=Microbacterium sp. CJ77 TaxID=2079201 RepID=UPI0015E182CD|nr:glycosyltransferase [Microbacterium sp. CJ77]